MYLTSLISAPLGCHRLSQRYVLDISDFMLVEILLVVLIIILVKGIFQVKISKLQFSILKTAETAKFLEKSINIEMEKDTGSKTSLPESKTEPKRTKSMFSEMECNSRQSLLSSLESPSSKVSINSGLTDPPSNKKSSEPPKKREIPVPTKGKLENCKLPASQIQGDVSTKPEPPKKLTSKSKSTLGGTQNSSSTTYSVHDIINSSGATYSIKFVTSRTSNFYSSGGNISKPSKSVPQVPPAINAPEPPENVNLNPTTKTSKASKSLSQGLHSSNSTSEKPTKILMESTSTSNSNKTSQLKSQDIKLSKPKT